VYRVYRDFYGIKRTFIVRDVVVVNLFIIRLRVYRGWPCLRIFARL